MSRRLAAIAVAAWAAAAAGQPPAKKDPAPLQLPGGAIIVVAPSAADVIAKPDSVILSPEKYKELADRIDALQKQLAAATPTAPSSCELDGKVERHGGTAVVKMCAAFKFRTDGRAVVFLGLGKARAVEAKADDGKLPLLAATPSGLSVQVEAAGEHGITLELELPLTARGTKGSDVGFDLGLPRAPITTLALETPAGVRSLAVTRRPRGRRGRNQVLRGGSPQAGQGRRGPRPPRAPFRRLGRPRPRRHRGPLGRVGRRRHRVGNRNRLRRQAAAEGDGQGQGRMAVRGPGHGRRDGRPLRPAGVAQGGRRLPARTGPHPRPPRRRPDHLARAVPRGPGRRPRGRHRRPRPPAQGRRPQVRRAVPRRPVRRPRRQPPARFRPRQGPAASARDGDDERGRPPGRRRRPGRRPGVPLPVVPARRGQAGRAGDARRAAGLRGRADQAQARPGADRAGLALADGSVGHADPHRGRSASTCRCRPGGSRRRWSTTRSRGWPCSATRGPRGGCCKSNWRRRSGRRSRSCWKGSTRPRPRRPARRRCCCRACCKPTTATRP